MTHRTGLQSAYLKLQWAQRHLELLYQHIAAFYGDQDEPAIAPAELKHKPFRVPPVVPWSLIVGDAVHNMRCSLEHVAYALAAKNLSIRGMPRNPKRSTAFPILRAVDPTIFDKAVNDIEPEARKEIERFQPYDKRNLLWILAELDNTDKHEQLNIFPATISTSGFTISAGSTVTVGFGDSRVMSVDPATGEPQKWLDQPRVRSSIALKMVMPRSGDEFDAQILQEVHTFIAGDVLPAFERFFS